jgi:phosphatidylserine decarboxylase
MAVILVGALFVGSMATVACGEINPPPRRSKSPQRLANGVGREFSKGEELGRFNMGSTVILLTQRGRVRWNDELALPATVQLGQAIASVVAS